MWQLYFTVSCALSLACTARSEVSVCTLNGDCTQNDLGINKALERVSSDVILYLNPGTHSLSQFKFLVDLDNVSFIGLREDQSSVVTCEVNAGLAFFNVSNLTFRDLQIQGCGFAGMEAWMPVLAASDAMFDRLFQIPLSVKVALFLGNCETVTFSNVSISNTTGIGLLAINAVGQIHLSGVHFQQNRPVSCVVDTLVILPWFNPEEWIGGGAYFLYEDYSVPYSPPPTKLVITNSIFINNMDCGVIGSSELYIEYSASIQEFGYVIGAGGGLSVMMSQIGYPVDVNVYSTTFKKNMAKFGAGSHIGLFAGTSNCHVEFQDCTFDGNGAESGSFGGGGLATFFDLTRPPQMPGEFPFPDISERNNSLQVMSSSFTQNMAFGGGGAYVLSNYAEEHIDSTTKVHFRNCTFDSNLELI